MTRNEVIYIDSDTDDAKSETSDVVLISEGSQIGTLSRTTSIASFSMSQGTEPPSSQPVEPDSDVGYDDEEEEGVVQPTAGGSGSNTGLRARGLSNALKYDLSDSDDDLFLDYSAIAKERDRRRTSSVSMVSCVVSSGSTVL